MTARPTAPPSPSTPAGQSLGAMPCYASSCGRVTLYHGDCRDIMPMLEYDSILTDPPYGINKAEWDGEFPAWMWSLSGPAHFFGVMPGVWNILKCPPRIGDLEYQWTLSARLTNGMTRGKNGFGNWIPCLLYAKGALSLKAAKAPEWCKAFADWCESQGVSSRRLDEICGTNGMAGHWVSRTSQPSIPTAAMWEKIKTAINPPEWFGEDVEAEIFEADGDCKEFAIGREDKPDHPSPKPLGPTQWFLSRLPGRVTVDPFMGSGTTGIACIRANRRFVGIEKDPVHYAAAVKRIKGELAQGDLFHSQHNAKGDAPL